LTAGEANGFRNVRLVSLMHWVKITVAAALVMGALALAPASQQDTDRASNSGSSPGTSSGEKRKLDVEAPPPVQDEVVPGEPGSRKPAKIRSAEQDSEDRSSAAQKSAEPGSPVSTNPPAKAATPSPPATHKTARNKSHPDPSPAQASTEAASSSPPRRIVVREGSTPEQTAQLVPGLTEEQAQRERRRTEQLLASTQESLQNLTGRELNADQLETVGQVRSFVAGARSALDNGDPLRARNLAFKAYLVSADLLKH